MNPSFQESLIYVAATTTTTPGFKLGHLDREGLKLLSIRHCLEAPHSTYKCWIRGESDIVELLVVPHEEDDHLSGKRANVTLAVHDKLGQSELLNDLGGWPEEVKYSLITTNNHEKCLNCARLLLFVIVWRAYHIEEDRDDLLKVIGRKFVR